MDYFYIDWIVDAERITQVEGLIHIAESFDVEIRGEMIKSEEGFNVHRFFVRVLSKETLVKFRQESKRIGFDSWVETSSKEFQKLVQQYQGYELPDLKAMPAYFLLQGYDLPGRLNRYLIRRWAEAIPTYVSFDWIPMTTVTQDFVLNVLRQTDFCLGCDTRIGVVHQMPSGMQAQNFFVRVLIPSEVDAYKKRIEKILQIENWMVVDKQKYELGNRVESSLISDFVENINKLARANSDLHAK